MEGLFQYFSCSLMKMFINSSIFPVDIKFQYNSSIFKFSSIDGHPDKYFNTLIGDQDKTKSFQVAESTLASLSDFVTKERGQVVTTFISE